MADYYNVARVVSLCRTLSNDEVEPYFVSDDDYYVFIDRIQREVAEELLLLPTARGIKVQAKADDPWVVAPEEIIKPRQLVSETHPVNEPVTPEPASNIDRAYGPSWRTAAGPPRCFLPDMDAEHWRLVPTPVEDETFVVEGWAAPDHITGASCTLSVPDWVARHIHLGVLSLVFGIEDADAIYDPKKAGEYLQLWTAAKVDMAGRKNQHQRDAGRTVRYGGYP